MASVSHSPAETMAMNEADTLCYSTIETMNEADARPGDMATLLDTRSRVVRRKFRTHPISQVPLSSCSDLAQPMPCSVVQADLVLENPVSEKFVPVARWTSQSRARAL